MKIGIVIGSVRKGRLGAHVADWVMEAAAARGADYSLIDLASFDLPVLDWEKIPGAAKKQYDDERVTRWSEAIDPCDGYVFVTPEYNHSVPGGLKNAVDWLGPEWTGKALGLVSYGADGGVRAVEHWRQIMANFQMVVVRAQVSMSTFTEFEDQKFAPQDRRTKELSVLFEQLEAAIRRQQS